jgi:6-phosphogluconate dehydrogenase
MQLICEAYDVMNRGLRLKSEEVHRIFSRWNETDLESYLIEITADIFTVFDEDGSLLLDKIRDTAGQKGTGKWTGINALDLGIPVTMIAEAVFARALSSMKEERVAAAEVLTGPDGALERDESSVVEHLQKALLCAKILSYAQGFMLLRAAGDQFGWDLDYGTIPLIWREGCIIRSVFLEKIKAAFDNDPQLSNLLLDEYFRNTMSEGEASLRFLVSSCASAGIPIPAFSSALSFYDGYRNSRLPANLLQAQRDYFGAHTYERLDRPAGEYFHTDWIHKKKK